MKLKITFTDGYGDYSIITNVEETTLSYLIKDKTLLKIFKKERELEKKYNKAMRIKEIKDID